MDQFKQLVETLIMRNMNDKNVQEDVANDLTYFVSCLNRAVGTPYYIKTLSRIKELCDVAIVAHHAANSDAN